MSLASTMRAPRARVDWDAIKDRISIEAVAVSLLGPAEGRDGSRGLWWSCPFHEDRNPSFQVQPEKGERGRWICRAGCGSGDAIDLMMRREGLTFPEAKQRLAETFGLEGGENPSRPASSRSRPPASPGKRQAKPSGVSPAEALATQMEGGARALEAVERLWSREGREALVYLRERGFADETIGAARLGLLENLAVPRRGGAGSFFLNGISIPWFGDDGRLALLKVRQLGGREPRYIEAFRGRPSLYAPFGVRHGWPLIVCEGELDALLLAQELGHVASVVTLGSASGEPSPEALRAIRRAPRLFIATDADPAGDKAATLWPSWTIRVSPEGGKDWGEVHARGFGRIAYIWGKFLSMGSPPRPEDFLDPALYRLAPDESDFIEAADEREAIENEPPLAPAESDRHLREIGHTKKAETIEGVSECVNRYSKPYKPSKLPTWRESKPKPTHRPRGAAGRQSEPLEKGEATCARA